MAIALKCGCGKKFTVDDDQPGTKVRCPVCADLVDLPNVSAKSKGYDLVQFRKCPQCKREWPSESVVCIECGWNFETGKRMKTVHSVKTEEISLGIGRKLTFMRNRSGAVTLTLSSRFLFWTRSSSYRLADYDTLYTDYAEGDDDTPEYYYVEMEGPREKSIRVYAGSNGNLMREVIEALEKWGRFEIKRR